MLMLNAVKFLPAVNGYRLTPLNFDLTMPSYACCQKFIPIGQF
jgi:hypothetical protein